jgi:hypothetical protein
LSEGRVARFKSGRADGDSFTKILRVGAFFRVDVRGCGYHDRTKHESFILDLFRTPNSHRRRENNISKLL